MEHNFEYDASLKSDEELLAVIENRQKYLPETVKASIAALQYKGHVFGEEELQNIDHDLQSRTENAVINIANSGVFNPNYKNSIVIDPAAPSFYSRRALYFFTVLCGALFGSILLAINISKTKNKTGIIWVLLFGIGFTVLQISIAQYSHSNSSFVILTSLISAYCLDYMWRKQIGNPVFYRVKAIWFPLIIAVAIYSFLIFAVIYGRQA